MIEHALKIDPTDEINKNLKRRIESVISGKIPRPSFSDLF
jgi:hypothetical protein